MCTRRGQLFLLLDSLLHQLETTGSLNLPACARYLARTCCPPLLEVTSSSSSLSLEDYILAHEVLCEAVQSQGTVLHPSDLAGDNGLLDDLHMERQFCLATAAGPLRPPCNTLPRTRHHHAKVAAAMSPYQALAALHPLNQAKNNSLDFIAVDWSRVRLNVCSTAISRRASLASLTEPLYVSATNNTPDDYVNASWVPGYAGPRDFVLSHHPGPASLGQFWRMVYETRASVVVCLSIVPQPFWPLDAAAPPLRFELPNGGDSELIVWLESEGFTGGYRSARVNLAVIGRGSQGAPIPPTNDVAAAEVQLIFCPNWPHQSIPVSNCVHLVDCVAKLVDPKGPVVADGPVVVMDSFGATEAAIFCVLSSLVKQMDLEVRHLIYLHIVIFKKIIMIAKNRYCGE